MVRKRSNQLLDNLPLLQNLMKKDPSSYHDEFERQLNHFEALVEAFELAPQSPNKALDDLVMFLAQVSHCYPKELENFPQRIIDIMQKYNVVLDSSVRTNFCKALILMRNKNLLAPIAILELFFQLLRCQDKALRQFLENHIITDIKNINSKQKNLKLNTTLQNFMFTMLKDTNWRAAKMSLDIMIELYKKNIWNDAKTVNVIATACFFKTTKVMVAAIKFFLGKDPEEKESDDSDSDDDIDPRDLIMANRFNKKTNKRQKKLQKVKKLAVKAIKKKGTAATFNFSAIHLIYDPQTMAEKLFRELETSNRRFEVKLMMLDLISRLIGLHSLFVFNYYSYIQRFMQPHQREVTRILQFAAQASHDLVPPDVIEPMLKSIANNFITERNSTDAMAMGLNAVKEICARCPLSITEALLRDLVEYKNYKNRAVMMAARGLIKLFRDLRPELLHKKDRGRPTAASEEIEKIDYAKLTAKNYVPGADVLLDNTKNDNLEINSDSDSDDDQWIDVSHSADIDDADEEEEEEEADGDIESTLSSTLNEDNEATKTTEERKILKAKRKSKSELLEEKKHVAHQLTVEKIFTDEDFKKIDTANIRKHMESSSSAGAKKGTKRTFDTADLAHDNKKEFVKLSDIENIFKKRKHDKNARLESVKSGRVDREKFGYKDGRKNAYCSKTNKEKTKKKNFQMMRHKARGKTKKSFKDKQIALRNHLLKLSKLK